MSEQVEEWAIIESSVKLSNGEFSNLLFYHEFVGLELAQKCWDLPEEYIQISYEDLEELDSNYMEDGDYEPEDDYEDVEDQALLQREGTEQVNEADRVKDKLGKFYELHKAGRQQVMQLSKEDAFDF